MIITLPGRKKEEKLFKNEISQFFSKDELNQQ
jgi:hypothetical protein